MIGREKGKIPIKKILENRDKGLYHRIETLWKDAFELQERQRSKEQHQQGYLHCEAVENNIEKIISDDAKYNHFSPLELFLLSAAACYHDAGKSDDFDEGHATVAMRDIYSHPEKYHLSDPEGKVLSNIIGSHDIDEVFSETPETCPIGGEDVRIKLLSAIFRLADILHTDSSRIPHIIVGDAKKEDDKTRFRKLIQGWSFNNESQIELRTAPEDPNDTNIIAKGVSMMQKQLECVSAFLRSEGYPYEIIYSCDYRGIKWKAEIENKRNLIEMDFYTENEANIFKGRDIESKGLLKKVISSNISLLIGNSGVGKTSLIRAGLFAKLIKMGWTCVWTRPVNPAPLDRILNDINAKLPVGYELNDVISGIKKLSEQYETNDIIIAVDQFEDILRSPYPVKDELGKILLRVSGKSFRNVHILLSYRGDFEPEINSFLDYWGIINPSRFPLLGLDGIGAHDAIRSIFEINNVGISDELIIKIIKELEKESERNRFYPPFIQIVASSLINLALSNNAILTEELYNNGARSVRAIIGEYLLNRLKEFGEINSKKRINAEAILKDLVRDGEKEHKGKDELQRYLNISENELYELLKILVEKRLIRHLGNDNYEIIHDFLASKVEEIIKVEERPLRSARDILRTKALHYQYLPTPSLLLPNEMALLYSMRLSISPTIQEKELLIFSYLAGNGPALSWFREDKETLRTIMRKALSNKFPDVRKAAAAAFEKLATYSDLPIIKELIRNPDSDVRKVVASAFEKFGTKPDLPTIIELLKDPDPDVRKVAVSAFEKLVTHSDLPIIKEQFKNPYSEVRKVAVSAFEKFGREGDLLIIKDIFKDPDPDIKEMAVLAFRKLAMRSNLPIIIELFKDPSSEVRIVAVSAFEKIVTHSDLPIIKELLKNPNSELRKAAVSAYEKFGTQADLPVIKELIKDPEWSVRKIAVKVLKKIGTEADLPLIKEMFKDPDLSVRKEAVSAFEKLGTQADLPVIKEMLKDPNSDVRKVAVSAFEKLGTQADLPVIKEMLKDSNSDVRKVAVSAFEKLGTQADLPVIKEMLKDPYSDVKKAAVIAFEKLATHADIIIKEMFKDSNWNVRRVAVSTFLKFCTQADIQEIKEMLNSPYSDIRETAILAFEKTGIQPDNSVIKEFLSDKEWSVRKVAISTFEKKITTEADIPIIIELLNNPYSDVRKLAWSIIEKIDTETDFRIIKELFNSPHSDMRQMAIYAIEKKEKKANFPIIEEMLNNPYSDVRKAAISSIEKTGNETDLQKIKNMLKDSDWNVRKAAISAIEKLGAEADLPAIKELLRDLHPSVRKAAISVIEKLGTEADLPAIKELLKDINITVRKAAISAIEKLGTEADFPAIKELLKDADPDLREYIISSTEKMITETHFLSINKLLCDPDSSMKKVAISAFEKLGTEADLPTIKELLKDPDSSVRKVTVSAIVKFGTENDLQEITQKYINGEIINEETFNCLILLDKKFYSLI